MKGSVYLYLGDTRLTHGSFNDLQKLGMDPEEGLMLNFYDFDADDLNRPTYLCARGVLYRDKDGCWHADIDKSSYHSVLQSDVSK